MEDGVRQKWVVALNCSFSELIGQFIAMIKPQFLQKKSLIDFEA